MSLSFTNNIYAAQADETLSSRDMLVFLTLLQYVNHKTGACYPSQATIAKAAHCSLRTVANAIKQLVKQGHIEKIARKREGSNAATSNLYILPDRAATPTASPSQPADSDPMHHVHRGAQTPVDAPKNEPICSTPIGQAQATAPTGNPPKPGKSTPMHHVQGGTQALDVPKNEPVIASVGQAQTTAQAGHGANPGTPIHTQDVHRGYAARAHKLKRSNRSIDRSIDAAVRERIDQHFERDYFENRTEYFDMYQTFAEYMAEMLTDPQTVISKVPIKRERLDELMFKAHAGDLCDFLIHIHEIRPFLHIRAPKAYYKTAWIEWCRDLPAWRVLPSAPGAAEAAPTKPNYDDLLEDLTA